MHYHHAATASQSIVGWILSVRGYSIGSAYRTYVLDEVNGRMPHFAVPRYVRFVAELPKSPAQRIQKFRLREEGLTGDTWDREDHGYVVTR